MVLKHWQSPDDSVESIIKDEVAQNYIHEVMMEANGDSPEKILHKVLTLTQLIKQMRDMGKERTILKVYYMGAFPQNVIFVIICRLLSSTMRSDFFEALCPP